jgi:hypothetical protein
VRATNVPHYEHVRQHYDTTYRFVLRKFSLPAAHLSKDPGIANALGGFPVVHAPIDAFLVGGGAVRNKDPIL